MRSDKTPALQKVPNETIAYLVPEFPAQTHIFFWREIAALSELGVNVELFSTRRPAAALKSHKWSSEAERKTAYLWPLSLVEFVWFAIKVLTSLRILSTLISTERKTGKQFATLYLLAINACGLAKSMKRKGVKHVHIHSCGNAAYLGVFAKLIGGVSYSLTLHNPLSVYGPDQKMKWGNTDFAIVITKGIKKEVRDELGASLPSKIAVAPMGVDVGRVKRVGKYIPWSQGAIRIFSCGRLNRVKGHIDLIEAVHNLLQKNQNVLLTIAGEDDAGGSGYRLEVEKTIKRFSMESHVRLLGAVSEEVIVQQLELSHIFVLPSHAEPLGVALMEAMSMEVPCIATDAGGVPELISDRVTGLLVAPQTPQAISNAVEELVNKPEFATQLGEAGRIHICRNFSSDRSAGVISAMLRCIDRT